MSVARTGDLDLALFLCLHASPPQGASWRVLGIGRLPHAGCILKGAGHWAPPPSHRVHPGGWWASGASPPPRRVHPLGCWASGASSPQGASSRVLGIRRLPCPAGCILEGAGHWAPPPPHKVHPPGCWASARRVPGSEFPGGLHRLPCDRWLFSQDAAATDPGDEGRGCSRSPVWEAPPQLQRPLAWAQRHHPATRGQEAEATLRSPPAHRGRCCPWGPRWGPPGASPLHYSCSSRAGFRLAPPPPPVGQALLPPNPSHRPYGRAPDTAARAARALHQHLGCGPGRGLPRP